MDGEQQPTTAPVWTILRIEDQTAFQPGKGALRIKRVYYRLFDGSESYEDFPAAGFEVAKVDKQIDAQAQKLYQVLQLKGVEINLLGS